ncbi:MAG TPA: hypothetical protein VF170_04345 [Planctomycetaceae bacterium]
MNEQILIGLVTAALCGLGLWHDRRLLAETRKGRRLIRWFGEERALWVLRGLLAAGAAFGLLLAADVIRPIEWQELPRTRWGR